MSVDVQLARRCQTVRARVEQIAVDCGRRPDEVTIMAVTKLRELAEIEAVVAQGFADIGESRVQETEHKFADSRPDCRLHLIGHLQTNKVRKAVQLFDVIQSVDSLKLAAAIDREADRLDRHCSVLLEVNTSGELQKYGFSDDEVIEAAAGMVELGHLELSGLMTVGPLTNDENAIRSAFRRLRRLFEQIKSVNTDLKDFNTLSMGMSDDYHLAIQEGATMLRIGSALFGPRAA